MRLVKLIINNYKKFSPQVSVDFKQGTTILIGVNGSGKSTVIEALSLIFSDLFLFYLHGVKPKPEFTFELEYEITVVSSPIFRATQN